MKNLVPVFLIILVFGLPGCFKSDDALVPPTIYLSDFYHPHCDPDDHFDMATLFALQNRGEIDLKLIVIDYPRVDLPPDNVWGQGDPDMIGVGMMNLITGNAVPAVVGSSIQMNNNKDLSKSKAMDRAGIDQIINQLEQLKSPGVIHVTGSARDLAFAAQERPKLFEKNCKAVYLNAGVAVGSNSKESNVAIDEQAYYSLFDLPCALYWLPCIHSSDSQGNFTNAKGEYSSWWEFKHENILPDISDDLKKFFLYMFRDGHEQDNKKPFNINWVRYLKEPLEQDVLAEQVKKGRAMWCTAGFLHAAGLTVTNEGEIVPLIDNPDNLVYSFDPIEIAEVSDQIVDWKPGKSDNRYILHIHDREKYDEAMEKALHKLLVAEF